MNGCDGLETGDRTCTGKDRKDRKDRKDTHTNRWIDGSTRPRDIETQGIRELYIEFY
jgi:hypothetical protein